MTQGKLGAAFFTCMITTHREIRSGVRGEPRSSFECVARSGGHQTTTHSLCGMVYRQEPCM